MTCSSYRAMCRRRRGPLRKLLSATAMRVQQAARRVSRLQSCAGCLACTGLRTGAHQPQVQVHAQRQWWMKAQKKSQWWTKKKEEGGDGDGDHNNGGIHQP